MARKPETDANKLEKATAKDAAAEAEALVEDTRAQAKHDNAQKVKAASKKAREVKEIVHDFVTIENKETGRTRVCDRPDLAFFKKQGYSEVKEAKSDE